MEQITEDGLFNYATTTGALYNKHCAMARDLASERAWYWWTRVNVQRAFTQEQPHMTPLRDDEALKRAAKRIRQYYENHVNEMRANEDN